MINKNDPRPRLLKEIPVEVETVIYKQLRVLHLLFPSYRDDQLFTFWLGRLAQTGVDITNFSVAVSFTQ